MTFSSEELERYARHIVMRDIGGAGQQKLAKARVLVVGAGGLGGPALLYLAGAGVGTLGVADHDKVTASNLQRQILFSTAEIGHFKAECAAAALVRLNPHVTVTPHLFRVDETTAPGLIGQYDLVIDGSDNFSTRYAVSDACFAARRPLVTGALGIFDASITTIRAHETGSDGTPNPTYRCLFPKAPPPGTMPSCAEAGVLGALPGIAGSILALEAIREIVGFGSGLVGRLLHIDTREMRFYETRYAWDADNPLSGEGS